MLLILLIVVCVVLFAGGMPGYGPLHAHYGYYPVGLGTILLILLIVVLLSGRL